MSDFLMQEIISFILKKLILKNNLFTKQIYINY